MFCTSCGKTIPEDARLCPYCGKSIGAIPPVAYAEARRLVRPREGRKIAGVCLGIARYFGWDPTAVRVIWLLLVLGAGTGLLAYLIGWIVMPNDPL